MQAARYYLMSEFTVKQPPCLYDYNMDELYSYADNGEDRQNHVGRYGRYYSDESFWRKIKKFGRRAGAKAVYHAVLLWYVATKPGTPLPVKLLIFGGLGYFILPVETIPDFLVGIGYADDLAVLVGIITAYGTYVDDASKAKARAKVREIFGPDVAV
ncbi:MAG: hypothetical protein A4E28_00809 [Methanocella sp. PtaU1.Bin125]|nr:MAG: hypothetical protein A4E28_00809 [Methanocella sp. PtaU1.Bin125]